MTSYQTLDYQVQDGILTLTLSRPEQLNAFTIEMAEELGYGGYKWVPPLVGFLAGALFLRVIDRIQVDHFEVAA